MRRLNIFVDETGDLGLNEKSSRLYGITFVFHEHKNDITSDIETLNEKLRRIGFSNMIHTADLILKRGEYYLLDVKDRKTIFNSIFYFSRKVDVLYSTIIIDKKYINNSRELKKRITIEIDSLLKKHNSFFECNDRIVMYYDNGQEELGTILDSLFIRYDNFEHVFDFDKQEKRLFQVADMMTYIDKFDYKYKNKLPFSKSELYFFSIEEIRKILKDINKKRLWIKKTTIEVVFLSSA